MEKQFLIAGFGGQGVLLIGQLIAKAAMREDYEVSWMPSYGPEMRGGEANCAVVVSDEEIGSPLVTEPPVLVAMNKPSLAKFMPKMAPGGILLYNASLIEDVELRDDITFYVMYGDWVARIATYIAALALMYFISYRIKRRNNLVD